MNSTLQSSLPILLGLGASCALLCAMIGVFLWKRSSLTAADLELRAEENVLADSLKKHPSFLIRIGSPCAPYLERLLPESVISSIQQKINLAGHPKDLNLASILATYCGLGIVAFPLIILYLVLGNLIVPILLVLLVCILPAMKLVSAARKRRETIDRDLPDFMDVLAVTVSSGVSFRPALALVAARFGGPLSEELTITLDHINNGASLRGAFSAMRTRTDSEAVNEFVSAYIQSEELGIPLVDTLKQISNDMRASSAQRNLQKAHKTTPKITLISTMILVPAVLIVMIVGMLLGMDIDTTRIFGS